MDIRTETSQGVLILRLKGEIRMGESAQALAVELDRRLSDPGTAGILVDLSAINYMDSTGLGELVGYLDKFKKQNKKLKLLKPAERVVKLMRLTRLDEVMEVHDDEARAIATFHAT